jgi:hypothetical protein
MKPTRLPATRPMNHAAWHRRQCVSSFQTQFRYQVFD